MKQFITENKLFLLPLIFFGVVLGGFMLSLHILQLDLEDAQAELREYNKEQRTFWDSLDCFEKNEYLEGKDLSSSTLFYYNINEVFYREYILDCG